MTTRTHDYTPMLTVAKAVVEAAGKTAEFEADTHFHLRVENAPFMALVIESWPTPEGQRLSEQDTRRVSVAHYYVSYGDKVADPEVELTCYGYPVELDQQGHRTTVAFVRDDKSMVRPAAKREVESFLRMWARNVKAQGFVKAAKAARASREGAR